MRPLPTEAFLALRRLGGTCELVPLGQAAHHVLQLGADGGVVALALPARLVGGISKGGFWRRLAGLPWRGRLVLAHGEVRWRQLKVCLGEGVCQRAAGLCRGMDGHGGQLSSVTSQDLLLHALRLIHGWWLGCWVSFVLLRSQRFSQTRHRYGLAPASGGAGQTQGICRLLPVHLRRGGDRGFEEEEGRVEAVVSDAWESASVDRWRLGVQDAELLIKLLRYLTRKLDKVAAVEFSISPVEPAQEGKSTTNMTLVELLRPPEESRGRCVCVCENQSPIRTCSNFMSINQHKPLVNLPSDPHTWPHVVIGTSYGSHPHLLQREEETEQTWQTAHPPSSNQTWQGHIFIGCHSMLLCTHTRPHPSALNQPHTWRSSKQTSIFLHILRKAGEDDWSSRM